MLITVISAPHHVKERDAIRKGWGATALAMPKVALVFLVGQNESLLTDLIDESDHNQDLVITNHVDSLKIHCWCQQKTATALFYSGGQHQEMSLDRIFDMARSLAGKTVPLSNFPHERRKRNFS